MNSESILDLIALGFTEREARLYIAMMEKPEWRASELQRITGIQRTHVHRALEVMVSRHYCTKRSEGRYNFYRATSPEEIGENLKHQWEDETAKKIAKAEITIKSLGGVYKEMIKGDRSLDFIEVIQTPHRIQQRFTELLLSTKKEHLSFNRSPYSFMIGEKSPKKCDKQTDVNKVLIERGINIRTVMMYEKEVWKFFKDRLKRTEDEGIGNMRFTDYLPVKMGVFDRDSVLMCVNTITGQYKGGINEIILHDTSIANACADLFELYWQKAYPHKEWEQRRGTD